MLVKEALELLFVVLLVFTVKSINNKTIRLTDERWLHIVEGHPEMAGHLNDVFINSSSTGNDFASRIGRIAGNCFYLQKQMVGGSL